MRILVVDDHEVVRRGICSVLATESSLTLCGEAVDGKDAVEKAKILRPDIIVMDITMPQMNGLDATREIKRLLPDTEIVIVSQHEAPEMVRQAFNAGARAYVVKSTVAKELLAAIAKVNKGEPFVKAVEVPDASRSLDPTEVLQRSAAFERALRESEERFRSAMTNIAEGLVMLDVQGRITYMNPAAETLFGWTCAELLGKDIHEKTHYKYPDGSRYAAKDCPLLKVLRSGVSVREHEDLFIRKDGNFFPVLFSASPVKTEGAMGGVVVCFRDDSHRKEAEHQLQQLVQTLESRVSERTVELEKATAKLRELTGTLLQTQDEERRRIARELHDGAGQLVVAMSMNLANIVREKEGLSAEARRTLEQTQALIEQASREIRTMSHLLHPPLLDEVGLDSALRWYIDGFSERSKIIVETKLASGFTDDLPRDLALSIFRIVQESLTNIHRHSESSTALVQIDRSPREITLVVEDEGKGMPAEIQSKISSGELSGVGLRGMRERVRQFGGNLEVRSNGNGTRVVAILPIPKVSDEQNKAAGHSEKATSHR